MSGIIDAVTKFRQTGETLRKMTETAIGEVRTFQATELSGGLCNAVYLIEANGEKLIIKIAPEDKTETMSHECGILKTEADALRLFNEKLNIPIPRFIYYDESRTVCAAPYLFISFIEGGPLMNQDVRPCEEEISKIKRDIGIISREICSIPAPCFGVAAMPETHCSDNFDFIYKLFAMLLKDAGRKSIEIPEISVEELLSLISSHKEILNEAKNPRYIHTDTWDGNIMVKDGVFTGLIDFAAVLYGDPLMSHDFLDFSPEPRADFLDGFGKTSFTANERIRIVIYKIWMRLGMIVERGYRGYEDKELYAWVLSEFTKEVNKLKNRPVRGLSNV